MVIFDFIADCSKIKSKEVPQLIFNNIGLHEIIATINCHFMFYSAYFGYP